MSDGTIDITNLVEMIKNAWIKIQVTAVFAWLVSIPGLSFLGAPIIRDLVNAGLNALFGYVSNQEENLAFFENTAIRKYAQAGDFVKATNDLNNLPPSTTKDEYEKYENLRMSAFRNFVMVSN